MRIIKIGVPASAHRITASAIALAGCLVFPAIADPTALQGDFAVTPGNGGQAGNLSVAGDFTAAGYADLQGDVGVGNNLEVAGSAWAMGALNFGWSPWDTSVPGGTIRFLATSENTAAFDVSDAPGSFVWRQAASGTPETKMKLGTDNSLSLYSGGTATIALKGGSGQIHLSGTGSGIYSGGSPIFSVGSAGETVWGRELGITSTTASTSSTTGALTVAGGLGVASDSFINSIRVGKGGGITSLVRKYSTVLGENALGGNTTGSRNTAVGNGSLQANLSGSYNTALGHNALNENTTGFNNTASGSAALQKNLTGTWNSAYGYQALNANTDGTGNAGFGGTALSKNTSGIWNTGMGLSALRENTTGSESAALGCAALLINTTGAKNTSAGAWALAYNTVGQSNVGLGWSAGRYQADGTTPLADAERSIYIGANSKGLSNDDDNAIVIGDSAVGEGANTTVIGNENTTSTRLFGETKVEDLRVSGKVIIEEPQGDISMGIYE